MVKELYADRPASYFDDIFYARLGQGQELIGVYGYHSAHYVSHLGFLTKEAASVHEDGWAIRAGFMDKIEMSQSYD